MRKLLFAFLLVCPPCLKTRLLRWLCGAKIGRGVRIGWFSSVKAQKIEIGEYTRIHSFSLIQCRELRIGAHSVIGHFVRVSGPSSLFMGRHTSLGSGSAVNVREDVRIGDVSAIGARCMIVTHGVWLPYTEGYWVGSGPVTIGERVWLGSGVFIQPGVTIGNEVFVNAMSVVKKDLPDGVVAEGFPARVVMKMAKLKRTMTPKRLDEAATMMLAHFAREALERLRDIPVRQDDAGGFTFTYRGRRYLVACVFSDGTAPTADACAGKDRIVLLANRPEWAPPPEMGDPLVIDLTTMRTPSPKDAIHAALRQFLKDYYGLKLDFTD